MFKPKVIICLAEEGAYWARVPALAGCVAEGDSKDEALNSLKKVTQDWLEVANDFEAIQGQYEVVEIELS